MSTGTNSISTAAFLWEWLLPLVCIAMPFIAYFFVDVTIGIFMVIFAVLILLFAISCLLAGSIGWFIIGLVILGAFESIFGASYAVGESLAKWLTPVAIVLAGLACFKSAIGYKQTGIGKLLWGLGALCALAYGACHILRLTNVFAPEDWIYLTCMSLCPVFFIAGSVIEHFLIRRS